MRIPRANAIAYCLALAALPLGLAQAQYFGRNKVLWEQFEFEVLATEHFAIHHYPPRAPVSADVAWLAERWYGRLSDLFEHEFDERNPLILKRVGVAYVSDSSYYGFLSPRRGRRFRLEYEQSTGDLEFGTTLFDYRRYFFTQPMTIAFRALHVGRRGADAESPQLAWLDVGRDRGYDLGSFDLAKCTLVEGAAGCPEFERLLGSRIAVLNLELRVPLLGNRDLGVFRAPRFPLEAVAFVDVGAAWRSGQSVDWRFARDTTDRVPVVSAGIAARVLLGGFLPLQIFYAKPYQRPREHATFGFTISTGW